MARVAILEPSPEVQELFARLVAHLGHEPVLPEEDVPDDVDLLLVEPASPAEVERARRSIDRNPGLVVVCASIDPVALGAQELGASECLVKPVDLSTLAASLRRALAG